MPNIAATLQNTQTDDKANDTNWLRLRNTWEKAARVVNGRLGFGNLTGGRDNLDGNWITVTTPAPNTDFTITHNLGRPVAGYIVMSKTAAGDVYTSPTANPNPNTQFILRSTAVLGTTIVLFVV